MTFDTIQIIIVAGLWYIIGYSTHWLRYRRDQRVLQSALTFANQIVDKLNMALGQVNKIGPK